MTFLNNCWILFYRLIQGPIWDKEKEINKQRERVAKIECHQIVFNTVTRTTPCRTVMRHNKSRTPSYPIYQGLKLHTEAKLKTQVLQHEQNGSYIGYEHVRDITKAMAIRVSEKNVEEGEVVVPTNLKKGVFKTSDFEVGQNTRSSLAIDEFHGTLYLSNQPYIS